MKTLTYTLIFVVALVILAFIAWTRVPDVLANNLSKKMKVAVNIEDIELGFSKIQIDDVEVSNPKGFSLPKALTIATTTIDAPFSRYLQDRIIIDEVLMEDIYLGLEFLSPKSTKGNWTLIMANLKSSSTPTNRRVLIKRLVMNNISVDVLFRHNGGGVKHLKPIAHMEFTNVSSETGVPSDQIAQAILTQMLESVFQQQNLNNMLKELLENPPGGLNDFLDPFKGLF